MAPLPEPPMPTVEAIYRAYEARAKDGYREHLGASLIAGPCHRAKWYVFRWMTKKKFPGRLLRLFDTGNLAEARFVADLRATGATVFDVDPSTGKQFKLRDETGHFGGEMDSAIIGLIEAPKTWHVGEFKTHSAKSFASLKKQKVKESKPAHYGQMQSYMGLSGMVRAFYLAVNKDTDELYSERIEFDPAYFARTLELARRIITAANPPQRISDDPSWKDCRFCDHHDACHGPRLPERHCRSCMHSTPLTEGEGAGKWHCALHGWRLNMKMQLSGCGSGHRYIPLLIKGEQIDAAENGEWIDYRMPDGSVWRDRGKES